MNIANVVPLFKSGDKHAYIHISLVPRFSKIIEFFYSRLHSFITKHKLLNPINTDLVQICQHVMH